MGISRCPPRRTARTARKARTAAPTNWPQIRGKNGLIDGWMDIYEAIQVPVQVVTPRQQCDRIKRKWRVLFKYTATLRNQSATAYYIWKDAHFTFDLLSCLNIYEETCTRALLTVLKRRALLQFDATFVSIFKINTLCTMKTISILGQRNKKIMRIWSIWQQYRLLVVLEVLGQINHTLFRSSKRHMERVL